MASQDAMKADSSGNRFYSIKSSVIASNLKPLPLRAAYQVPRSPSPKFCTMDRFVIKAVRAP